MQKYVEWQVNYVSLRVVFPGLEKETMVGMPYTVTDIYICITGLIFVKVLCHDSEKRKILLDKVMSRNQ